MPNFHPQLVASVTPLLEPGEEVWAVYPSSRRSLIATGKRLFLVAPDRTVAHALDEFEVMRRPRPSVLLLQRRSGGALRIDLDPNDEHGIQALTVIGLLVAHMARPNPTALDQPGPARTAPAQRHLLTKHHYVLHPPRAPAATRGANWPGQWASLRAPRLEQTAGRLARHCFRLGLARFHSVAKLVE